MPWPIPKTSISASPPAWSRSFLLSKLPTIIILVSLLAGLMALLYTPREEDPQIKVPMVDILIRFPGASPTEVENLVVINLEKKLWEMEGLEDLYSQARDGFAIVTAKFKVGENLETSLFKVYNKIFSNHRPGAPGVTGWVVKPMSINDVPIVTLTLYSNAADDYELQAGGGRTAAPPASHPRRRAAPTWWPGASARCGWWPIRPAWPATAWIWPRWPRPSR